MGENKSSSDSLDVTTVVGSGPAASIFDRPRQTYPALTVLWHPDIRRVGDCYVFSPFAAGNPVELSRKTPDFVGASRGPLDDAGVSRRPMLFLPLRGGGLRIDFGRWPSGAVEVDCQPAASSLEVERRKVERGLVLTLGNRVVLLLHLRQLGSPDNLESGLVGVSAAIERVRSAIERAAPADDPVLIRGETGTGKELVARALHDHSQRSDKPFVAVNLGAISSNLAVAELFGSKAGAFTDAQARKGYFKEAEGGTLFLDEIGDIDTKTQVALLRAVELREIQPAGSHEPTEVDVRVLAATDANLEENDFRVPLLHRLSAHVIEIPPLRLRKDDIGCLFLHFLRRGVGSSFGKLLEGRRAKAWIHPSIVARLAVYDWPGNVRELENVVRQLVAASRTHETEDGEERTAADETRDRFAYFLRVPARLEDLLFRQKPSERSLKLLAKQRPASDLSKDEVLSCLEQADWTPAKASQQLGVSHQALDRLMRKFGIRRAADLDRSEIETIARRSRGTREAAAKLQVSERALVLRMTQLGLKPNFTNNGARER